ncbi:MAG: ATP-binding protein [Gracilibacteraceae bacterium]|jgi:hypothetical protein|nr:ATP-binding protein [Gracilibacteraceae bacterium]
MDANLAAGLPPEDDALLTELSVGVDFITDFWLEQYLDNYIALGGSKMKFLTGDAGSGKTHCLRLFLAGAARRGYKTVLLSTRTTWLHDFRELYAAVLAAVDLPGSLARYADAIVREMGYAPEDFAPEETLADFLSRTGRFSPLTRREIREQIADLFLNNPRIDNNFALACSALTGGLLGYPALEPQNRSLLLDWLGGEKVRMAALRKLGLTAGRITKHNARHMLRSLAEVLHSAGHAGLIVGVDDMDIFVRPAEPNILHYTKLRREDAYESIRELIDEIDTLSHLMLVFSFERRLLDDERIGLKSYQALWMRIQNEIDSDCFNRFADIIDLDRLARLVYTPETLVEISRRLAAHLTAAGLPASPVDETAAAALKNGPAVNCAGLPRKLHWLTCGGPALPGGEEDG